MGARLLYSSLFSVHSSAIRQGYILQRSEFIVQRFNTKFDPSLNTELRSMNNISGSNCKNCGWRVS